MTKLPGAFVAVATWLVIFFLVITLPLTRALSAYTGPMQGAPRYVNVTWLGVWFFVLFMLVSFLQLRLYGIWLSIAFAGIWAASSILRLPMLHATGAAPGVMWAGVVSATLNSLSVWYLSRPSVLSVLERRRAERVQESLRRSAERAIQKAAHS
jgi:hypothetical protein